MYRYKEVEGLAGTPASNNDTHRYYSWSDIRSQAQGQWPNILTAAGIDQSYLTNKHKPCPICGGRDRFRFDDKNGSGSFYCSYCSPGDGFRLLQLWTGKRGNELLQFVAGYIGAAHFQSQQATATSNLTRSSSEYDLNKQAALERIWKQSLPISAGDPAHKYLTESRRLALTKFPAVLRYHPNVGYTDEDGQRTCFPAMIALVQSPTGEMVNIHRTYLTIQGEKAPVATPKKLMPGAREGSTRGAAIKLFTPGTVLAVCEGIETALACHLASGLPVWSAISAPGMASLIVPSDVTGVIILADNDVNDAGNSAAQKLKTRLLAEGKKVKIVIPEQHGADWDDILSGGNGT